MGLPSQRTGLPILTYALANALAGNISLRYIDMKMAMDIVYFVINDMC